MHVAVVVATGALFVAAVLTAPLMNTASAAIDPDGDPGVPIDGAPSEVVVTALAEGRSVDGYLGPDGSVSDPAVAYPPSHSGFPFTPMDFAGLVDAEPPEGGPPTLSLYCTDIRTDTSLGYGYDLGDWTTAGTANAGYVARILNDYYPATNLPADGTGIADDDDRAAAVQAAIWYFTDNFVVAGIDARLDAVSTIVNSVRTQPPLPAPAAPTLSITPAVATGDTDDVLGPFTVATSAPDATLTVAGAQMYTDAAGTVPLSSPATVVDGQVVYLRSASVGDATLTASATLTTPSGSAYLYDGNIVGVDTAQNLILADAVSRDASAGATAQFQAPTTTTSTSTTTTTSTTIAPTSTVPPSTTVAPTSSVAPTMPPSTFVTTTTPGSDVDAAGASTRPGRDTTSRRSGALAMTGTDRTVLVGLGLLLMASGVMVAGARRTVPDAPPVGDRRGQRYSQR